MPKIGCCVVVTYGSYEHVWLKYEALQTENILLPIMNVRNLVERVNFTNNDVSRPNTAITVIE